MTTNRINLDQDGDSVNDYAFDAASNTTRDPQLRKFTYDAENKQTKVETVNSSGTVTGMIGESPYDGDGRRVKKRGWISGQWEETIFVYDASSRLVAEYATILNETPQVAYLTADHLGSPRINTDENGKVTARHDYLPFGEEINAGTGGRTTAQGYGGQDNIRQKFTGYERDAETDLDFAQARMYNKNHGRFTTVDPTLLSVKAITPQSWNRYTYVLNNPLTYTDPLGLWAVQFQPVYKKKDGKDTTEIDHYIAVAVQTKLDKDTPAELARQLGLKGKEADKFVENFGKKLTDGKITTNNVQLSKLGGDVGRVFRIVQDLYTDQQEEDAKGEGKNPSNGTYADCSSTAANLNSPLSGANGQNWSVGVMDKYIRNNLASKSEDDLRIGDVVRYADVKNDPKHFTTFIFRNDDGVPQVFSRSGEGGRFETGSASNFTSANPRFSTYGTIRGKGKDATGYYGRR